MEEIKSRFRVEGMDCASCALKVDKAARRVDGVREVSVSATAGTMVITHDGTVDFVKMGALIGSLGYRMETGKADRPTHLEAAGNCASGHDHDHDHNHGHDHDKKSDQGDHDSHGHSHGPLEGVWWKSGKARLAAIAGAGVILAYGVGHVLPAYANPAFMLALAVGLAPIVLRAFQAARYGTPFSIETLMTIAAIGAVLIGASEEAAMVVFLFLIGELLEGIAATRARNSIRALSDLVPKVARVETDGAVKELPAADLMPGMILLARPGDRIAADGTIFTGEGEISEAPVTGESVPVRKGPGDPVFAGTINGDAALKITVTATAADNTIARVIRLVEEAQESKAPMERFIDRFSRYYTPGILVLGALVALLPPLLFGADWSQWIYKGLALLLIGCPCALVISTPAAIAAALSAGARNGLLLKGGAVLEAIGRVDTVAFDKTGTLTEGKPIITDILAVDQTEDEVLSLAAALETGSSHPLARAILDRAGGLALPAVSDNRAIGGRGVEGTVSGRTVFLGSLKAIEERITLSSDARSRIASLNGEGKTVSLLLIDDRLAGVIALRDEPRDDARAGIRALDALGIRSLMLTGDNYLTAAAVGSALGMDVKAELLPQDKQQIVSALKGDGRRVAKVGDGINDAPALAAADVGIAMGGGTDVALETADAAILNSRVTDVARMIRLSRAAMRNIHQNIALALGLKGVFLVTTLIGITGLWPAILADTGATVLVTFNALRLLRWRG